MKRLVRMLAVCLLLMACAAAAAAQDAPGSWLESALGGREDVRGTRQKSYVALLEIDGEISEYDYYYDHLGTLDAIDALIEDRENIGLVLLLNTPGGSLYEADELLHEIKLYKELTGRPVAAYMEQECCSAGVYIAMGADLILASRMTITGNVGVYMESMSEAGLYEKLGIERIYVATGENKVDGYPTLTQEQREILQGLVDESFEFFLDEIEASRGLTREQMEPFMDGRLLSALQAKELGLIDEVCYYDEAMDRIYEDFAFGSAALEDITPVWEDIAPVWEDGYGDFDESGLLDWLEQLEEQTGAQDAANSLRRTGGLKAR